jgi:hypothetical protein
MHNWYLYSRNSCLYLYLYLYLCRCTPRAGVVRHRAVQVQARLWQHHWLCPLPPVPDRHLQQGWFHGDLHALSLWHDQ